MKEIKRYTVAGEKIGLLEHANGEVVLFSDYEQLQARIKELESAERTLITLGYENKSGEFWKPPIGKKPDFILIDRLNKRIEDLDLERKKAFKAGSDYFNQLQEVEKHCNELAQKVKELESQSHINEIKAQGIEDMLNDDVFKEYVRYSLKGLETTEVDDYTYLENVRNYVEQLRTKHD